MNTFFRCFAQKSVIKPFTLARFMSEYSGPSEKCLNMVQLLGRVGQDPVLRGEKSNFMTFSLATSISYPRKGDTSGEYQTKTEWHNICVFRPYLIERMKQVKKGNRLMVVGSIEYVSYNKVSTGDVVDTVRIVPDDIIVLTSNSMSSDI